MKSADNREIDVKHNIRLLYLCLSGFVLLTGVAAVIFLSVLIFSTGPSMKLSPEEQSIISRAVVLTQPQTQAAPEEQSQIHLARSSAIWQEEIASGRITLSEFIILSFTGTQYLLEGKDDLAFAKDLSFVIFGSDSTGSEAKAAVLIESLSEKSRVYVIEETLREMNAAYASSDPGDVADKAGTRVISALLDQPIQDDEGYGFGVRKVSGQISIQGDQVRTDFYIDDNLRPGQLSISQDISGKQNFSMAWDTRKEEPGIHSVIVLMRTSDGRGQILSGGNVTIPSFFSLINDGVQKGSMPTGTSDIWYQLDAQERNAYINFVDLSGDIRVSLYDMYGNILGQNDLPGIETEVLRGRIQDLPEPDGKDPYVSQYQNMFYARVQHGSANLSAEEITYLLVQSKEVAVDADGNYLAVTNDVGTVPTPIPTSAVSDQAKAAPVICKDLNANTLSYVMSDLSFLPINGRLASLTFSDAVNKQAISYYPVFDTTNNAYGYVSATELSGITSNLTSVEGYAATVVIEQESDSGVIAEVRPGEEITVTPARNTLRVKVIDFDGITHTYTLYLLSGADKEGYYAGTLSLFPQSYQSGIWLMHNLQPTYQFAPYDTGISWAELLASEDNKDKSLASDSSHPHWVKAESPIYDGSSWRAAKTEVVAYFLDPRSFLDPVYIFQFEKLSFDPSIHTKEGVAAMVKGSFLEAADPDYTSILLRAGSEAGISPYFVTSRIIQEMGRQGESHLAKGTLPGYEGYYNFFNIGSSPNPDVENGALINGARYAMWGSDPDAQTIVPEEQALLLPWTSPDLAIRGGALWVALSYINLGQNTLYFQKFDVIGNEDGLFIHQYAQNISMAYSEGSRYHRAYLSQNMLSSPFQFIIPVYLDMPQPFGTLPKA